MSNLLLTYILSGLASVMLVVGIAFLVRSRLAKSNKHPKPDKSYYGRRPDYELFANRTPSVEV